jgi:hypothetical protein
MPEVFAELCVMETSLMQLSGSSIYAAYSNYEKCIKNKFKGLNSLLNSTDIPRRKKFSSLVLKACTANLGHIRTE